jgi:hypothetical protein
VGAKPPVTFFAYPGKTSWPTPKGCKIIVLSHAHEDGTAALDALADALNATPAPVNVAVLTTPALPKSGKFDARAVIQVIAHYLPDLLAPHLESLIELLGGGKRTKGSSAERIEATLAACWGPMLVARWLWRELGLENILDGLASKTSSVLQPCCWYPQGGVQLESASRRRKLYAPDSSSP